MITQRVLAFLFSFIFLSLQTVSATMVLPLGLDRLHGNAELVFVGDCLENRVAFDAVSGRVVTFTTFQVIESLKGKTDITHTIKQVGGNLPDAPVVTHIAGVPQFDFGKRYLVFLPPASSSGFSTPVGLMQGVFPVETDATGQQVVSNGRDVSDLLTGVGPGKLPARVSSKMSMERTPANRKARVQMRMDDMRTLLQGMGRP